MQNLFLKLYEAFATAAPDFEAAGLKPIATIDRYRGQPIEPEAFEYFDHPALFVGRQTTWSEEKGGVWVGTPTLEFHLLLDTMGETGSQYTNHEEALGYFKYITQVRKVLDNFRTDFTSKFKRANDNEVDTGVFIYEIIRYTFDFEDWDAVPEGKYVDSEDDDLELRGGLVKHL